jgi:MoaA/NifB/PqqE/SkfB family radical SAM enzyme
MSNRVSFGLNILKRWPNPKIVKANMALTWRCNHRCLMCSIWKHNNEQKRDNELTAEEIYKILKNNGIFWCSLTGGEPFLNNQVEEIMNIASQLCQMVSINTNGSMPERVEKSVKTALKAGKAMIVVSVSLEGDPATHDNIVGVKGSHERAIETLTRLRAIKNKRFYPNIEHVLSTTTNGQWRFVEKLAEKLDVDVTYTQEQNAPYYRNQDIEVVNDYQKPVAVPGTSSVSLFKNLYLSRLNKPSRCVAGEYSIFIDPYTNIYPCLLRAPENKLGNLRESSYLIEKPHLNGEIKGCKCWTPCESYTVARFRPWRLLV